MTASINDRKLPQSLSDVVVLNRATTGTTVYVIGAVPWSSESAQKVDELIRTVQPRVVVLQIPQPRLQQLMSVGDSSKPEDFGLSQIQGKWKTILFTGSIQEYVQQLQEVLVGALLGCRMDVGMRAAVAAAAEVNADIEGGAKNRMWLPLGLLALLAYASSPQKGLRSAGLQQLEPADPQPEASSEDGMMDDAAGEEDSSRGDAGMPSSTKRSRKDLFGLDDVDSSAGGPGRTSGVPSVLTKILKDAGCDNWEDVVGAMRRVLEAVRTPEGGVSAGDLLTVRNCGRKVLAHNTRDSTPTGTPPQPGRADQQEAEGASDGMLDDEADGVNHAPINVKPERVHATPEDLVMARKLWEVSERTGGEPVVGVVSRWCHSNMRRCWNEDLDKPATVSFVQGYNDAMVQQDGWTPASFVKAGLIGGGVAIGLYRAPKLVGISLAGMSCVGGWVMYNMRSLEKGVSRVVEACQYSAEPPVDGGMWSDRLTETDGKW